MASSAVFSPVPMIWARLLLPSLDSSMILASSLSEGTSSAASVVAKPWALIWIFFRLSLNSAAWPARSPLKTTPRRSASARRSAMPALPLFSSGIMSAPALPNNSTASAAFSGPSRKLANLSAMAPSTWSLPRRLPSRFLKLTPMAWKAAACSLPPPAAAAMFRLSLRMPVASASTGVPTTSPA